MTSYRTWSRRAAFSLALLLCAPEASARPVPLTAADRAELELLLHTWFDAVRDGNEAAVVAQQPTAAEWLQIFAPGAEEFLPRQLAVLARDSRELRARFAGGVWVGFAAPWAQQRALEVGRCGRVSREQSECCDGPVLEWRVGTEVRHMRVDRLVRVGGHWRLFDARI